MNSTDFKREGRITNGACPLWTRIFKQSALNAWRITVMALNNTDILGFLNDPTKSFKQVRRRMYYFKESGYNNDHPPLSTFTNASYRISRAMVRIGNIDYAKHKTIRSTSFDRGGKFMLMQNPTEANSSGWTNCRTNKTSWTRGCTIATPLKSPKNHGSTERNMDATRALQNANTHVHLCVELKIASNLKEVHDAIQVSNKSRKCTYCQSRV